MLRRLSTLTPQERRALALATRRVLAVRAQVAFLPLGRVLRRVRRQSERPLNGPPLPMATLVWSVRTVSRRLLRRRPCLTQALALWGLLERHGYQSQLRIGVAREGAAQLKAHAWIEKDGRVLIGGRRSPDAFVPLPSFEVQ